MRIVHLFFVACLLAPATGCLVSEQIGGPVGHGTSRRPGNDVTIHFNTGFNRIVLFGRSAALLAFAAWIFRSFGARSGAILFGGAAIAAAGWLLIRDYPALTRYRIEVAESGLTLEVPPDLEEQIPWPAIQRLLLEGWTWQQMDGVGDKNPYLQPRSEALELPDWETMTITLSDGQTRVVDLSKLSIEQRQIFAKALIKRAGLVKE